MLQDVLSLCFKDYFVLSHLHLNGLFVSTGVTRINTKSRCAKGTWTALSHLAEEDLGFFVGTKSGVGDGVSTQHIGLNVSLNFWKIGLCVRVLGVGVDIMLVSTPYDNLTKGAAYVVQKWYYMQFMILLDF